MYYGVLVCEVIDLNIPMFIKIKEHLIKVLGFDGRDEDKKVL